MKHALPCLLTLACALVAPVPAAAQDASRPWSATVYLQQSWPKQTETNRQIKQDINGSLGTSFQTWDDVANGNLGLLVFRTVAPKWKAGFELDYSQGGISGRQGLADFGLGPGNVAFEQKYSVYADLLAMVQYRPLGESGQWSPFLNAGVGLAYEKDRTLLTFNSSLGTGDFELLKVDNSGWFPVLSFGLGVDVFLTKRRLWFAELGASYSWARLKHSAPATGLLAPAPTVTADTDSTGPNLWFGVGRRF